MLVDNLRSKRINVIQSVGNADCDIVTKTVIATEENGNVILVGEDTDLLILVLHFSKKENVFTMRPVRQGTPNRITKIFDIQNKIKSILKKIFFIHAAGGCDTMSGLYKIGKIKVLQLLEKLPDLRNDVPIFYNPKTAKDDIVKDGERFLVSLYGDTSTITLDELRFKKYNAITTRQNISTNFNLAALPPTKDAAKFHISRIYFQIQEWLGLLS
ncbi:unnamed protein product [Ceutorhynchus assimilis]|uniref:Uncharacterized protein n=1 Tax=Ceutorhynchus assimilis TaxID=467358 RepID=A0A9N9QN78_9CUCU|nr:unnamed protein product [Ceutorhynchus assimilis]